MLLIKINPFVHFWSDFWNILLFFISCIKNNKIYWFLFLARPGILYKARMLIHSRPSSVVMVNTLNSIIIALMLSPWKSLVGLEMALPFTAHVDSKGFKITCPLLCSNIQWFCSVSGPLITKTQTLKSYY